MPKRPLAALVLACACLLPAPLARAEETSADALLKLLPANAGAAMAVENLRDRWAEVVESDQANRIRALPAFRAWLDSPGVRDFTRARDQILNFLQTSQAEIRDEILGDAVVLAILPPRDPAESPSRARGLLALKARKPDLLKRLIDRINEVQKQEGEIAEVVETKRGELAYFTRRFPDAAHRLAEVYVLFPDGVFALSNSEAAIREAIDRKTGAVTEPSFPDAAGFAEISAALKTRPPVRLFLAPEFLLRALEELPAPEDAGARALLAMVRGRLADLNRLGAALEMDGARIQVRAFQAVKPEALKRPGGVAFTPVHPGGDGTDGPGPRMTTFPETAFAAASFRLDAPAAYVAFLDMLPEKDRVRAANLETIADALLLGRGLRSVVLPAMGPRAIVYLEGPDPAATLPGNFPLPIVTAIEINEEGRKAAVADALENALRAFLAAATLEGKKIPATARVTKRDDVTSLDVPYPFAFAVDGQGRRLVAGSSADSVARYLRAGANPAAGERFRAIREAGFPDCDAFAAIDLPALADLAEKHEDALIAAAARRERRKPEDVARDLDQAVAAARLFDAAFLAARYDAASGVVEHRAGLLARPSASPPATTP